MKNTLRTDITFDRTAMTKEQEEAYDDYIDLLVELCRESTAQNNRAEESRNSEDSVTSA